VQWWSWFVHSMISQVRKPNEGSNSAHCCNHLYFIVVCTHIYNERCCYRSTPF
jgi:hypothetical protein